MPLSRPPSAQSEVERFMSRGYVVYRFANSASAVLRSLGQPELVRRPRLNWANHAIDVGVGLWLSRRLERRGTADDLVAEVVEASAGAANGAIGLAALHTSAAHHGTAWPMIVGLWRAAGTMAFSQRWSVRAAGFGALLSPYVLPWRRQRALADAGLVWGHAATLGGFASVGALIADGMRRRARDIDRRSDELARAQVTAAAHKAETALRQEVLSQTLDVMRRIRADLRADPDGCAELARTEEARLRAWISDAMAPVRAPATVPTDEAIGAELRVRALLRSAELTVRGTALLMFVGNLIANRRTMRWPWMGWALGATATAHFAMVVGVMRNSPDDLPYLAVAAGDTVMMIATTEWEEIQTDPPVGWISAYAMACATTTATMGTPRDGWAGPVALMCAWRAMAVLRAHDIALARRAARVACETIYIVGNAWLSHDFADASVGQARDLVTATTQLAFERRRSDLEVVRLQHQAIVHDGAIQVLLWVGKDDLTTEQIEDWLDQEIPRGRMRPARGEPDTPTAPLGPALEELAAGFGRLGVQVSLTDVDASPTNALVRGALVEVVNEALTNVLRHTSTRTAQVSLRVDDDELVLRVVDGGRAGRAVPVGAGTGTATIRDLAAMIGGTVDWTLTPTGGVAIELHCPAVA